MDVDSTLITAEVIELLADRAGSGAQVATVTQAAMRGELDFTASLHARVATLAGLPVTVFDEVRAQLTLTPGAAELLAELARRDWPVGLVSGGFLEVVAPLAAGLGITMVRANRLEVRDGVLTGRVEGPVIDREAKVTALRDYAAATGVPLADAVAVGDGANDLGMIELAGLGVAFGARPVVAAAADAAISGRLDALLPLLDG